MRQIEIRDLAQHLSALLAAMAEGEEIVLTETQRPVAKLIKIESAKPEDLTRRGDEMASILEQLAAGNAFSEISDPVAWQREAREDRPLPRRE